MKNPMVSFLCNPYKIGAYCSRVVIPHQAIVEFWKFLSVKAKENRRRLRVRKPMELDREYFEFMRSTGTPDFFDKDLDDMLNFLVSLKSICPKEVAKWSDYGVSVIAPEYFTPSAEAEDGSFFFAPQTYFADIQDAISVRIDYKAFPDVIIDATSLTPRALSAFKSFVTAIPFPKSKASFTDEEKRHSKRFVFDLYPAVAALWIDEFAHRYTSRDTIDLLDGVLEYMDKREWQMSIILSSFSIETILVEIYEEIVRKEAPPAPIGFLIKEINAIKKFPSEALKNLKMVNEMRKAAVHRGMTTFTQEDAILTLMGTMQFVLWYCFNSKDFCNIEASNKPSQ